MKKIISAAALSMTLSACGGGGDEGDNGNETTKPVIPPSGFVSGKMVSSSDTGFASFPGYGAGFYGGSCRESSSYFESSNVRVYAERNLSDDDYKSVATVIQNNMGSAFDKMGFTIDSLNKFKPIFNAYDAHNMILKSSSEWVEEEGQNISFFYYMRLNPDYAWPELTDETWEQARLNILDHYQQLEPSKTSDIYSYLLEHMPNSEYLEEFTKTSDKVTVCLSRRMGSGNLAEGTLYGVNIAEPQSDHRVLEPAYSVHELIHHVQNQYYRTSDTNDNHVLPLLPRWFTEGQATYLAGQNIARKSEAVNTSIDDMNNASDRNQYYAEYGLAYSYLHLNNEISKINQVFTKTASGAMTFDEAFDSLEFKNHMGEAMTYKSYRDNYGTWVPQS